MYVQQGAGGGDDGVPGGVCPAQPPLGPRGDVPQALLRSPHAAAHLGSLRLENLLRQVTQPHVPNAP